MICPFTVKRQIWAIPSPKHEQNKISAIFLMIQYFQIHTKPLSKNQNAALMVKLKTTLFSIDGNLTYSLHLSFFTWAASSEFGTYRLCEQRRFRRAWASAQSRQNLHCLCIQAVSQEESSDRKPDPWPLWMAGHAKLKFVMTECSRHKFAWRATFMHRWAEGVILLIFSLRKCLCLLLNITLSIIAISKQMLVFAELKLTLIGNQNADIVPTLCNSCRNQI